MYIFNNNHNDKEITQALNKLVGKPFSLIDRFKQKGIGSRRIVVESFSPGLFHYFDDDNDLKKVNFELRPKGIIVYIKNKINDYKWAIPYYALHIYNTQTFSIHAHGNFLKFKQNEVFPYNQNFFDQVMSARNLVMSTHSFIDR